MLVPPGWITLMPRLVWVFGEARALDVRRVSVAAARMKILDCIDWHSRFLIE